MYLNCFITVLVLFTVLVSVFGATCYTYNNTCVATTWTLATCTNKVCDCRSPTVPIHTGCGFKFGKPSLMQSVGYSTEILAGKSGVLTCKSDFATVYEWSLSGTTIPEATGNTYTITSARDTSVGPYICKAKEGNLDSEYSIGRTLTLKVKTDTISKPVLKRSTDSLFAGKSVTFKCEYIPIGYNTSTIVYKFDNSTVTTSTITFTSADTAVKVICSLTDTSSHLIITDSIAVSLPTIVADISAVTIENIEYMNSMVYPTDVSITLTCLPTPDVAYIDKALSYAWLNNSVVITGANSQTYVLPKIDGAYQITCQANYTETPKTSPVLTITRDGTYLTKPVISGEPSFHILGGHLTLTCGTEDVGTSYSWKKDSSVITSEEEHKIQLDNLTSSDAGAYTCTIQKRMAILTSEAFSVLFDITGVVIENSDKMNNMVYTMDESITLKCSPTPDYYIDKNISYAWLNNSVVITGANSQTYVLPKIDGTYQITCQAKYTETPKTSSVLTITRDNPSLTKPVIIADPATPVLGSLLTLACGSAVNGATYSWKKYSTNIARQFEQIIQFDNLTTCDNGAYVCTVKRNNVTQISDAFTINVSAGQEIVKVSMLVLGLALLMSKVFA